MQCPKCHSQDLHESVFQLESIRFDIMIEYCQRCKGFCLQKDQLQALLGTLSAVAELPVPKEACELKSEKCPNCTQAFYAFCYPATTVQIDVCQNCTYLWLDDDKYQALLLQTAMQNGVKADGSQLRARYTSYAEGIPGVKGRLLRYIDKTMNRLQNSLF